MMRIHRVVSVVAIFYGFLTLAKIQKMLTPPPVLLSSFASTLGISLQKAPSFQALSRKAGTLN
jgi:hypothetical protein